MFLYDKGRWNLKSSFNAFLVASWSFSFSSLTIECCSNYQDCRKSGTEDEKTMSLPPSQTDVILFTQDDDEELFDIVNSPLASFHESERSCQEPSAQVSEDPLSGT